MLIRWKMRITSLPIISPPLGAKLQQMVQETSTFREEQLTNIPQHSGRIYSRVPSLPWNYIRANQQKDDKVGLAGKSGPSENLLS